MARMIPADVPTGTPHSERRIFDLLKRDPAAADWTVLHSVGLRRTRIGPYGEIDFVIVVPGKGVCCLEVKGGDVSCADGIWRTRNRKTGEIAKLGKSPYLQAREGMFELRRTIQDHFGQGNPASGCPFSYAVVFPDVASPPATTEADEWEIIDISKLVIPISKIVAQNISRSREKISRAFQPESCTADICAQLTKFLRPDFERIVARSASIRGSEEQLIALTEEQYDYLDIASVNDRALVTGAAGTGKTLLALEYARREASAGRTVLLLCYNRLLGEWLNSEIEKTSTGTIIARTFHSHLRSLIVQSSYAKEFEERCANANQTEVFAQLYPLYGELAISEMAAIVDTLIIDEAQDLLRKENVGVFNALLRGGMSGGRWAIFGDFNRQAIYGSGGGLEGEKDAVNKLKEFVPTFPIIPLKVNCRNTRQVGEETALLSGFDSLPYRLAHVDGLAVDYRYYKNQNDEVEQLTKVIEKLLNENVNASEIVILSPTRFEHSAASRLPDRLKVRITELRNLKDHHNDRIAFCTVHAFKGLESPTVILCGFSDISGEDQRSLLYVGMSRARSHLVLVVGERTKALIPGLVSRRLSEKWTQ